MATTRRYFGDTDAGHDYYYLGVEMKTEILSTRKYKVGYEIRTEKIFLDRHKEGDGLCPSIQKSAYTPTGDYIGNSRDAHHLIVKKGIKPELRTPTSNVCSIGFCEAEQKWYGWSHRAIYGYGVGDIVKEGSCPATSGWTDEYLAEHPEEDKGLPVGFEAKTLDDARKIAIAFAESVG